MSKKTPNERYLVVTNAHEHNLKQIDVQIPHNSFTVVTGVSGSGKSTLVSNVIFQESQRRFLSSFSSFARQYMGKLEKPKAGSIKGLQAALAIKQQTGSANPHSTVGTISGVYDYLRLLFARMGRASCIQCGAPFSDIHSTVCTQCGNERPRQLAKLFSFNSLYGACPNCNGLGITEQIDINKLIANPQLSLRQGALVPTTPTGYIVYSQVTVDALDTVCRAHGFNVDIPWKDLTEEQKNVVLYGSERVKILFGKHSLESRLKWKGITARPREEAYYKGMMPIMTDILKRDRNDNILRFASAFKCPDCNGSRLRNEALAVEVEGSNIAHLAALPIIDLEKELRQIGEKTRQKILFDSIMEKAFSRMEQLKLLGLGYLSLDRISTSLSGGEMQRIRLAAQIGSGLQGVLYVLDEPSIGLHPHDNQNLLMMLKALRDNGNTLLVVEHDEDTIRSADYLIDIGPKAGAEGGQLLFQGAPEQLLSNPQKFPQSITAQVFSQTEKYVNTSRPGKGFLQVLKANQFNLKSIDVRLKLGALNLVTGVSGAGKSTLIHKVLAASLRQNDKPVGCEAIETSLPVDRLIEVDQSPIGRTPRSNPATYTGIFDAIRDVFAAQPEAKKQGFKKGRFSFNNEGGRCEYCSGAGSIQLGMHFLGDVEVSCEHCEGKRFNEETLAITFQGKNIFEVLELTVEEAADFFAKQPKISKMLQQLIRLDVGYLKLGQPSTTLSGGEAQRVKLASELQKSSKGHNLYLLDEPTVGLHKADVAALMEAINGIVDQGNTVIVIEHDPALILQADWLIDLGPGAGEQGGEVVVNGPVDELLQHPNSLTGNALRSYLQGKPQPKRMQAPAAPQDIELFGISTNKLKNIDVRIPHGKMTVVTGVSGSGKSSLAFDTVYAESRNRFTESYTSYARRMMSKISKPELEQGHGFSPAIAIRQSGFGHNPRSTVGTMTGLYDLYRLLFSRAGLDADGKPTRLQSGMFSFNKAEAACTSCNGLGKKLVADPAHFVTHPEKPLVNGAMDGTKPGRFFGEADGQYVHTLLAVGKAKNIDFSLPFQALSEEAKQIALYGCGDEEFDVSWVFKRGKRSGTHQLRTVWQGMARLIEEDYAIKREGKRGDAFAAIMREQNCPACHGNRLRPVALAVKVAGYTIADMASLTVAQAIVFFNNLPDKYLGIQQAAVKALASQIKEKLIVLQDLGLGYLSSDRAAGTLSGGEAQRVHIASQLEADLCGLTYVIDEPTIGLHPRDTRKLLNILNRLKDNNNTMILVEHDPDVMLQADHLIDLGPGAGQYGGEIIGEGSPEKICQNPASVTGQYLNKQNFNPKLSGRALRKGISITGAIANNLQQLDLEIPTGGLIAVTGVSGSGKTSLVFDVIAASFNAGQAIQCRQIGFGEIKEVVVANQDKIGTSPLSNTATYTGIFDAIRMRFAELPGSKKAGLSKKHFSFNNAEGSCPHCKGLGSVKVSLDFLSDVWSTCDICHGERYKSEVLSVQYKGKNIHQVLQMEVSEALEHFNEDTGINSKLEVLQDVGLGYLPLGQATSTLSGGETQRLKLATELLKGSQKRTLYLFDEPTTGLHMQDVEQLLLLFDKLISQGHTVLVVEHNLDVIAASDYMIELGPEGGVEGGKIVFAGTVLESKTCAQSATAKYLFKQPGIEQTVFR